MCYSQVRIVEGAHPRLVKNTIRDGHDCGVAIGSGSSAVLHGNTIGMHVKANVLIYGTKTYPTLLDNLIERSEQSGIYMYEASKRSPHLTHHHHPPPPPPPPGALG